MSTDTATKMSTAATDDRKRKSPATTSAVAPSPLPAKRVKRTITVSMIETIPDIPNADGDTYSYFAGDRPMSPEQAKTVGDLLPRKPVRRMRLRGADITDQMISDIARGMKDHPRLEVVALIGNSIGDRGAADIADVLRSPGSNLRVLSLRRNYIMYGGFAIICEALAENSTLAMLDLSRNKVNVVNMDDNDVAARCTVDDVAFAEHLGKNRTLRCLSLAATQLGPLRMVALLKTLCGHPALTSLDLSWNTKAFETEEAMEALLVLIMTNRLVELKINYCDLGRYFWERLPHAMRDNHTLCSIKIKHPSGEFEKSEAPLSLREMIIRWIYSERKHSGGGVPLTIKLVKDQRD